MILKPVIASYSGESYRAIARALDARALDLVARVAESPLVATQVDLESANELVEMHVLAREGGLLRLDTAVFVEEDIRALDPLVQDYSSGLVRLIAEPVSSLRGERPEVVNFVVGILGIGQALGHAFRDEGAAVDWRSYGGRYASSKVDFDEVCDAYLATGEDLQTKTIQRGDRYTAVFIGPGGVSYLLRADESQTSGGTPEYTRALNVFLTDAYAMLITGELDSAAPRRCAEEVGLFRDGVPLTSVLTNRSIGRYLPTIGALGQITYDFATGKLDGIRSFLRSTRSRRQGVPVESQVLNLWRYLRKGVARKLYESGVFTDPVPEAGLITVFYANDAEAITRLLD